MIKKWIENLTFTASNDDEDARRAHMRRSTDSVIANIDGLPFTVENWSEGGLLLSGESKTLNLHDVAVIAMKFKMNDRVLNVEQQGKIIRKSSKTLAIQFGELNDATARGFKKIIDHAVTREFVESQIA